MTITTTTKVTATDVGLPRVIVTRPFVGICHMQVCAVADATDDEILDVCNRENLCGTERGWTDVKRSAAEGARFAPAVCREHPTRLHLLVSC